MSSTTDETSATSASSDNGEDTEAKRNDANEQEEPMQDGDDDLEAAKKCRKARHPPKKPRKKQNSDNGTKGQACKDYRDSRTPEEKAAAKTNRMEHYHTGILVEGAEWAIEKPLDIEQIGDSHHMRVIKMPDNPKHKRFKKVLCGLAKFIITNREWVEQRFELSAPNQHKASYMEPPQIYKVDKNRWAIALHSNYSQQSATFMNNIIELFLENDETVGAKYKKYARKNQLHNTTTRVNEFRKDMFAYVENIVTNDPAYDEQHEKYEKQQAVMQYMMIDFGDSTQRTVRNDLHEQGKQYFIHLYEHGTRDSSGIPAVEYAKPQCDYSLEDMDCEDILMHWGRRIPDPVKEQLQDLICEYGDKGRDLSNEKSQAKQQLQGLMVQHAVLLCRAYEPWNRVEVVANSTTVTPGGMLSLDGGVPHTVANTVSSSVVLVCALVGSRKNFYTKHFKNHESRSHTTTSLTVADWDRD